MISPLAAMEAKIWSDVTLNNFCCQLSFADDQAIIFTIGLLIQKYSVIASFHFSRSLSYALFERTDDLGAYNSTSYPWKHGNVSVWGWVLSCLYMVPIQQHITLVSNCDAKILSLKLQSVIELWRRIEISVFFK